MEIVCTIGPATNRRTMIRMLDSLGVKVFRLNLSHTESLDEIDRFVKIIQAETDGKTCLDTIGTSPFGHFDEWALEYSATLGIDQVAISFTQSKEAIQRARELSNSAYIIAKIESAHGVQNKEEIINEADAVLIDRGDLSKSVRMEDIPYYCGEIIRTSKKHNTPVWIATNLLESMVSEPRPTLSEVSDIASLISQDVDGLVLAAETAIGKYPVQCVEFIRGMIERY